MKSSRLSDYLLRNIMTAITAFLVVVGGIALASGFLRDRGIDRFEATRNVDSLMALIKARNSAMNQIAYQVGKFAEGQLRINGNTGLPSAADTLAFEKFVHEVIATTDGAVLGIAVQIDDRTFIPVLSNALSARESEADAILAWLRRLSDRRYSSTFESGSFYLEKAGDSLLYGLKANHRLFPQYGLKARATGAKAMQIQISLALSPDFIENLLVTESYSLLENGYDSSFAVETSGGLPLFTVNHPIRTFGVVESRFPLNATSLDGQSSYYVKAGIRTHDLAKRTLFRMALIAAFIAVMLLLMRAALKTVIHLTIKPLLDLESDIKNLAQRNFADEIPVKGPTEIALVRKSVETLRTQLLSLSSRAGIAKLASQVAHDIRSPLAAFDMVMRSAESMPEEHRIVIRSAVNRIRDIANQLINKSEESTPPREGGDHDGEPSCQLISDLLEALITEKRMQYRGSMNVEIDLHLNEGAYGLHAKVQADQLKRVISNLINNSVEAMPAHGGTVTLRLKRADTGHMHIEIADNGRGMPQEVLSLIGIQGLTSGKDGRNSGSGLGLYHAKTVVESWNGRLLIASPRGAGTTVTIELPMSAPPSWFVPSLRVPRGGCVAIVDDDSSIHSVWEQRLKAADASVAHFSDLDQFKNWATEGLAPGKDVLCLVDYEFLGAQATGLDAIEEMGIASQSILVTSRSDEPSIQQRCSSKGIGMIPKSLAAFVPLQAGQS